jgi:phospholipid/cholesterol/gamma-HCH transport system substrate-binding protein
MRPGHRWRNAGIAFLTPLLVTTGCEWHGANSLPLPGTAGRGPGAFEIQAQLPDVTNLPENSRVRVGDVTVGTVTKIKQQGWHALITIRLDGTVELPENATATVGQTSLLGSLHIELAPPAQQPPRGRLHNGSLIPLSSAGSYPTTEQTLAAFSMLLNNGGIGKLQDITEAFSTALAGRGGDAHALIDELNQFVTNLDGQIDDIITATDSLNNLVDQLAREQPVLHHALDTIPGALTVLKDQRHNLTALLEKLGEFSALATETSDNTKDKLVAILNEVGPVLKSWLMPGLR